MFRFEKLEAWQKAVELADDVYAATRGFPDHERFGLTTQMRRAAVSISSNIAEGSGRSSDADFARFIEIAYGSLMEVVSQSLIAHRQSFMSEPARKKIYVKSEELALMLSGLRGKLQQTR
jgi:four helix bundle protein